MALYTLAYILEGCGFLKILKCIKLMKLISHSKISNIYVAIASYEMMTLRSLTKQCFMYRNDVRSYIAMPIQY